MQPPRQENNQTPAVPSAPVNLAEAVSQSDRFHFSYFRQLRSSNELEAAHGDHDHDPPVGHDTDREHRQERARSPRVLSLSDLSMRAFDPLYYLTRYADLTAAFGRDYTAAGRHYVSYGVNELRAPNQFFEPEYYRANHPDLQNMNGKQLIEHWYVYGVEEGRRGCEWFDIRYYINNYADLLSAFGSNYTAAFSHWQSYGHRERRQTSPGKTLQLFWGDVPHENGSYPLADESRDCIPEAPIREEPSTGQILGIACKVLSQWGVQQVCKQVVNKIYKWSQGTYVVCNPDGSGEVHVREDPIFRGDIDVPDDITGTA